MEKPVQSPATGPLPVLMLIFDRPDQTRQVFEAVKRYRPARLYLAADGPRENRPGEAGRTELARRCVLDGIDWPCEVKTLLRSENLGVKRAVGESIDWFFENEESGVILEDDCLPHPTFFSYCQELLDRYRDDERVMHIGADCYLRDRPEYESYFFSKYPHIWGWATWRRAWQYFSTTTSDFEADFARISDRFSSMKERDHWYHLYKDYFNGAYDSWAYGWTFSVWQQDGLAIYPTANLVKNIGFGSEAVHTKSWRDYKGLRRAKLESIETLHHPEKVELDHELDLQNFKIFYQRPSRPVLAWKVLGSISSTSSERLRARFSRRSTKRIDN